MMKTILRILLVVLILPASLHAKKLAFKDGTVEDVYSYEIINIDPAGKNKKVRYLSAERESWEEAPLSAIDLERTERLNGDLKQHSTKDPKEAKILTKEEHQALKAQEEAAKRPQPFLVAPGVSLPDIPGIYFFDGGKLIALGKNGVQMESDKKRLLASIAGVPTKLKKSAVIKGEKSSVRLTGNAPSFYLSGFQAQQARQTRLLRLKPKRGAREISELYFAPITGRPDRKDQDILPSTVNEIAPGIYKISPTQSMKAGEYGFVITPPENPLVASEILVEMEIWDFGIDRNETQRRP